MDVIFSICRPCEKSILLTLSQARPSYSDNRSINREIIVKNWGLPLTLENLTGETERIIPEKALLRDRFFTGSS
jgi:hypothetical protein